MHSRLLLTIFFTVIVLVLRAQEIDSLEGILPLLVGDEKVDVLVEIASIKQTEGGEVEAKKALELAQKIGYKNGEITALTTLAYTFLHQGEYDKAKECFQDCIGMDENLPVELFTPAYIGLGHIAIFQNQFIDGLDYTLKALSYAETSKITQDIIEARHNLIQLYDSFSNWKLSATQLQKILLLKDSLSNDQLATLYLDMAANFHNQGQYKKALSFYEKGKNKVDKIVDNYKKRYLSIYMYGNMAGTYNSLNMPDSAIQSAKLVLKLGDSFLDDYFIALIDLIQSKSYLLKKDYDKAKVYADRALNFLKDTPGNEELKDLYEVLKEIAIAKNDFKKATELDKEVCKYADSVANAVIAMNVMEKMADFRIKENAEKIKYLEAKEKRKLRVLKVVGFVMLILMMVTVLLYFRIKHSKRVYEKKLQKVVSQWKQKDHEQKLLQEELGLKDNALASNAIFIANKNKLLSDIKSLLENTVRKSKGEVTKNLRSGLREIQQRSHIEEDWQYFNNLFKRVQPDFYDKVRKKYPGLTETDYRLCVYIYLGLSNKEISQLQNITVDSVRTAKYRLKKKMGIKGSVTDALINICK